MKFNEEDMQAAVTEAVQRALGAVLGAVREVRRSNHISVEEALAELERELVDAIDYERKVHAP